MKNKFFLSSLLGALLATSLPCITYAQEAPSEAANQARPMIVRRGLPNVAAKLRRGEEVSVVFLGGSVTEGGGNNGYVARVSEWLQRQYPQAKIKKVNAGVGGTNSDYGWQRMERDVLVHKPDLLVVEFAVNDGGDLSRTMEALVHKAWKANPKTDIVFLYHTMQQFLPTYASGQWHQTALYHEKVARYYNIPVVGTGYVLAAKVNAGGATWTDLVADSVHPRAAGYAIYVQAMTDAFQVMLGVGQEGSVQLPSVTLTPNLVVDLPPFLPVVMPEPQAFISKNGEKALVTYQLPIVGVHWANEPQYRVGEHVVWRLYHQSTDNGKKLNPSFGLDRTQWKGLMAYFRGGNAFSANQPYASPLAYSAKIGAGTTFGSKEATMGVLSFTAPRRGRYVFSVRSNGVRLWSNHKAIALNVVHFPVGQTLGTSVAFGATTVEEKADLNLEFPVVLKEGDEVAFEVDTNAHNGGGGAFWEGLNITAGFMGN